MKNMAVLIDTNIILDWLLDRESFPHHAEQVMRLCIDGKIQGYLASHSILNIFYITRKDFSISDRRDMLLLLCNRFEIIGIDYQMLMAVLNNDNFKDIEDGLQIQCAEDENLDYIVTRNIKDFGTSKIKAFLPEEFLRILNI